MIQYDLKTTNIESTDPLKEYLDKRMAKIERFVDTEKSTVFAQIELEKVVPDQSSGDVFRAEMNLHIDGDYIRSEAQKEDMYKAIDEMQEETIRDLKRMKGKRNTLIMKGARKIKQLTRKFTRSNDTTRE